MHVRALAAGLALAAASGCAFHNIDIRQDTRIAITSPSDGGVATMPVRMSWKVNKQIGEPGQTVQYAVFVDRTVIKPGQSLRAIIPSRDKQCRANPQCLTEDYLQRHGVYLVDQPSVSVTHLDPGKGGRVEHRLIVIILIDGKRSGEGAFSRGVFVTQDKL